MDNIVSTSTSLIEEKQSLPLAINKIAYEVKKMEPLLDKNKIVISMFH